jgi:hypothetical protein
MQVSNGRPHKLRSNQRGRGQEPVMVQGRMVLEVMVNIIHDLPKIVRRVKGNLQKLTEEPIFPIFLDLPGEL